MTFRAYSLLYNLRFLFAGVVVIIGLALLVILLSVVLSSNTAQAKNMNSQTSMLTINSPGGPNVITSGMFTAAAEIGQAVDSAGYTITTGARSAASAAARSVRLAARGTATGITTVVRATGKGLASLGRAAWSGVSFVGRTVGSGLAFVARIPGNIFGLVSGAPVVNSVIRPADAEQVPIIDPDSPELLAALAALPARESGAKAAKHGAGPAWPLHGDITAAFGVPHRPYQPIHTGIDISDHRRAGVTRVKPFRPGRVIDTIYSRYGFGNHVIVDHGNGVTSLYGHLDSIAVKVGQKVNLGTTLGREGTTGLSTGVHLHFEIRVNGQAADPRKFIAGRP